MKLWSWLFGRRFFEPAPVLVGMGRFDFEVVGESHYQEALSEICGGKCSEGHDHRCLAVLRPEPGNFHDGNAVQVFIDDRLVAYLSRSDAAQFTVALEDLGFPGVDVLCHARITGGWLRERDDEGQFGVELDIAEPFRLMEM